MDPRDYQINIADKAVELLQTKLIAYLVMQVRTGKTLTAFLTAQKFGANDILFVTKKKAINGIVQDLGEFDPTLRVSFINYESLHKTTGKFDLVIIDEAHSLGQYPIPSQRTQYLCQICRGLPILFLSGTPTPETYSQWYHQFAVSSFSPFQHRTFYAWFREFGVPKKKYVYNRELNDYSEVRDADLRPIVEPYLLTYTQEQAGFKMPVTERIEMVPMPDRLKTLVRLIKRDKLYQTKSGKTILADTAVKEMGKIHQICSGTVKDEDGGFHFLSTHKVQHIMDHYDGKKIAIFYKYVAEFQLIQNAFGGRVVTDPVEFNRAGPDAVFVSQIQSGREGINIATADCLIMYNIDFSATSYWQARARLQTRDRANAATVVWLFTDGGIESYIYEQVQKKKDFTVSHYSNSYRLTLK